MNTFSHKIRLARNKAVRIIASSPWWKSTFRAKLYRIIGMKIGRCHIGSGCSFDTEHPEDIEIGNSCAVTSGVKIITHYVHSAKGRHWYTRGKVKIGNNVHIGLNVLIIQPVTIGDDVIIGAGSVVTKNIPSGEIWGGIPAKFIKKVEGYE